MKTKTLTQHITPPAAKPLLADSAGLDDELVISEKHEKWLKKFNKTREGQLFNLRYKWEELNMPYANKVRPNKANFAANALWIATEGTKMEEHARFFIEMIDPDFFEVVK